MSRERETLLQALWEEWEREGGTGHAGPARRELSRVMFERQVLTVGSGEDVRMLSARARTFFAREDVRSGAARVVEIDARRTAFNGHVQRESTRH